MEARKSRQNVKKGKKKSNEVADRFSSLPDYILHHIFSYLNMEEAVRSSVFSKSWRNFWTSLRTLDFKYEDNNVTDEKMEGIKGFIDKLFILPDGIDIQRFSFFCSKFPQSHVDTWILSALSRNVQELVLGISVSVPTCLFDSETLTLLKLSCFVEDRYARKHNYEYLDVYGLQEPGSIWLPNLKTLFLESFFIHGGVIDNFVSSCPVLESLTITNSFIHNLVIQISSLSLKHLVIEIHDICEGPFNSTLGSVELTTPNLRSFRCRDYMQTYYYLEDISSLFKADICMIQGVEHDEYLWPPEKKKGKSIKKCAERMFRLLGLLCNVKDLTLCAAILEVISCPSYLVRNPIEFRNLRCLKVDASFSGDCIHGLKRLLKISPTLETLLVNRPQDSEADVFLDMATYKGEVSLPCSLDKLEHVEIRGATGCGNVLKLIEILLKNTKVLKQLVVCPSQK